MHILLIAILGILVYSNTLNSPFVFDDDKFIQKNPLIRDLKYFTDTSSLEEFDLDNLGGPLTKSVFRRRLISFFSFALNYRANGLDVTGYHIVDITIHILNAFLLYLLVILTFRTPRLAGSSLKDTANTVALMTALIFVSHPVQTQAVTYTTQRFTLLATCFYLLSLTAYIRSRLSSNRAAQYLLYSLSFIFAATGMMTKEITFTLPVVIVLYEFVFFEGPAIKRILRVLPFMLTMLIIPYMLLSDSPDINSAFRSPSSEYSRWEYLLTQFTVIVTYIRLLFIPVNQNLDYDYPLYDTFFTAPVFLSSLLLFSIFCFACWFYLRTRKRDGALSLIPFGIFWFFITVSVESSVVPTANLIFEHRAYLPSAGVFPALTAGVFLLFKKSRSKKTRTAVIFSFISILLVLSSAAYARNSVWQSRISLWKDVVSKSPEKAKGYYNLSLAYMSEGLTDESIEHYRIFLKLQYPAESTDYRAKNFTDKKDFTDKAVEHYRTHHAKEHNNLGNAYWSKGLIDKAIEHYLTALDLKPDLADTHYNLGIAYGTKDMIDKAIEHFQIALNLKPDDADAHFNLGLAYLEKGSIEEARREFETALQINPSHRDARQLLKQTKRGGRTTPFRPNL